jgi:hypothetical protein
MSVPIDAPPYFHALAVFACKSNRLYRVYVRPDELVCIWAGSGMEGIARAHAAGAMHGALGALLAHFIAKALDPSKKNEARKRLLDSTPLEQLIPGHPKNLRVTVNEIEERRILPRSERHAGMYSDHAHQALLILRHRSLGKYRLGIASVEDVRVVLKELPRVLGDVCRVETEWSEREMKFVKRKD